MRYYAWRDSSVAGYSAIHCRREQNFPCPARATISREIWCSSGLILDRRYLDIVENPTRPGQQYFILTIDEYTWVVPFVVDDAGSIVLKTAFPSRKYHRLYGGRK